MARRRPMLLTEVACRNLWVSRDEDGNPRYAGRGPRGAIKVTKKAAEAVSVVAALAVAAQRGAGSDGGWPTQQEYARYWNMSERSAQREWDLFKEAFPGEESPDRLAQWVVARMGRRLVKGDRDDLSPVLSVSAEEAGLLPA